MPRRLAVLALLGTLLQLLACGRSAPSERTRETTATSSTPPVAVAGETPDGGTTIVAVLGLSTASGQGLADPTESWVGQFAAHLSASHGLQVRNLAVPGYTTFHVLPTGTRRAAGRPAVDEVHNVTAALAYRPKAIIINLPSNDAAMGASVEESIRNLRLVAAKAKERASRFG